MRRSAKAKALSLGLLVTLTAMTATSSGCSFVRSSKISSCKGGGAILVDLTLSLAALAATGLFWEDEIPYLGGVPYVTIPAATLFLISMFYGTGKWLPPPGSRCIN